MKSPHRLIFALMLAVAPLARAQPDGKAPFSHVIDFELGAGGFYAGDNITIESVRGDRPHIEGGGGYFVEGTYILKTADKASLALYCTSESSGFTTAQSSQLTNVTRGSGKFRLYGTNFPAGWLHVSFYPHGRSEGGIYFGEKGRENTINRHQHWFVEIAGKSPASRDSKPSLSDYNSALIHYLGNPVKPPKKLDAKYSSAGLSNAVQTAARNAGITLKKLEIDDVEFPFLVGVICSGSDAAKLKAEIKKLDGYEYGGSIGNDVNSDGSDTCNVFSIVPDRVFPPKARQQIERRRMVRYQYFFDKFSAEK